LCVGVGYLASFVRMPGEDAAEVVDRITLNLEQKGDPVKHIQEIERNLLKDVAVLSIFPAAIVFVGFVVSFWFSKRSDNIMTKARHQNQPASRPRQHDSGEAGKTPVHVINPDDYK